MRGRVLEPSFGSDPVLGDGRHVAMSSGAFVVSGTVRNRPTKGGSVGPKYIVNIIIALARSHTERGVSVRGWPGIGPVPTSCARMQLDRGD